MVTNVQSNVMLENVNHVGKNVKKSEKTVHINVRMCVMKTLVRSLYAEKK